MEGFEVSESMVTVVADVYLRGRQMGGRRVNAPADLGKTEVRIDMVTWGDQKKSNMFDFRHISIHIF